MAVDARWQLLSAGTACPLALLVRWHCPMDDKASVPARKLARKARSGPRDWPPADTPAHAACWVTARVLATFVIMATRAPRGGSLPRGTARSRGGQADADDDFYEILDDDPPGMTGGTDYPRGGGGAASRGAGGASRGAGAQPRSRAGAGSPAPRASASMGSGPAGGRSGAAGSGRGRGSGGQTGRGRSAGSRSGGGNGSGGSGGGPRSGAGRGSGGAGKGGAAKSGAAKGGSGRKGGGGGRSGSSSKSASSKSASSKSARGQSASVKAARSSDPLVILAGWTVRSVSAGWMLVAGVLGFTVRRVGRSAQDLHPDHQRDGVGLFWLGAAILLAAGVWVRMHNAVGRGIYLGASSVFGDLAFTIPLVALLLAWRYLRHPAHDSPAAHVAIGWAAFGVGG